MKFFLLHNKFVFDVKQEITCVMLKKKLFFVILISDQSRRKNSHQILFIQYGKNQVIFVEYLLNHLNFVPNLFLLINSRLLPIPHHEINHHET